MLQKIVQANVQLLFLLIPQTSNAVNTFVCEANHTRLR